MHKHIKKTMSITTKTKTNKKTHEHSIAKAQKANRQKPPKNPKIHDFPSPQKRPFHYSAIWGWVGWGSTPSTSNKQSKWKIASRVRHSHYYGHLFVESCLSRGSAEQSFPKPIKTIGFFGFLVVFGQKTMVINHG
jgi:hypothetical protein